MEFFKQAKSQNYDNFMDLNAKIIIFGKTREQDMFFIHLEYLFEKDLFERGTNFSSRSSYF